jgi:hypothetical protein
MPKTKKSKSKKGAKKSSKQATITIQGKGKYSMKSVGRALAKGVKGANRVASSGAFGPEVQMVSKALGALSGRLSGSGAYSNSPVNCNSLFPHLSASRPPVFGQGAGGCVSMVHREYLGDFFSGTGTPTAFTSQTFGLNPGLTASFPFLSQIASNFDSYRFLGLVFEYKTTSGMVSGSNQALGTVAMACQYNVYDAPFINKFQLDNYEGAISCAPFEDAMLGIECKPSLLVAEHLYTRTGPILNGTDQRLYDVGVVTLASQGVQNAGVNLGEIWVSYHVELYQPKLYTGIGLNQIVFNSYASNGTQTGAAPYQNLTVDSASQLLMAPTTNWVYFPANTPNGVYMVTYSARGASTACSAGTLGFQNCSLYLSSNVGGTTGRWVTSSTAATFTDVFFIRVDVYGSPLVAGWNVVGAAIPTGLAQVELAVVLMPFDLYSSMNSWS